MTKKAKEEDKQKLDQEPKPLIEDEVYPQEEPDHPGWLSIAEIMKISDPVFENSKFLIGYHHSSNVYVLAGDTLTVVDPGNDYTIFNELDKLGYFENPPNLGKKRDRDYHSCRRSHGI